MDKFFMMVRKDEVEHRVKISNIFCDFNNFGWTCDISGLWESKKCSVWNNFGSG